MTRPSTTRSYSILGRTVTYTTIRQKSLPTCENVTKLIHDLFTQNGTVHNNKSMESQNILDTECV